MSLIISTGLSKKRGKDSAIMLKYDVMELFDTVIKHDPSLYDLLNPQLKLLKDHYRLALSEFNLGLVAKPIK